MAASFGRIRTLLREGAAPMTSAPVRDPLADHLLTPDNAAFLLIDYQPSQLATVRSMDHDLLLKNAVSTVRAIKTFEAVLDILGVGDHLHFALFLERLQALDRRGEFHAVIGGVLLGVPDFLLQFVEAQDGGPTAGSGIAEAGAIGDKLNFFHGARTGSVLKKASTRSRMAAEECTA